MVARVARANPSRPRHLGIARQIFVGFGRRLRNPAFARGEVNIFD
jgi:hypothetical protein